MGLFSFMSDLLIPDPDATFEITPIVRPASAPEVRALTTISDWPAPSPKWRPLGREFFTDALFCGIGSTAGEITAIAAQRGARR